MLLSKGQPLGPYELITLLGTGGMGEVWKARDTRLDRIIAIKQLQAHHKNRFHQEARAIAALSHPNICQIHDIGPDYLVLEYVQGSRLQGPYPPEVALPLAIQIASALQAAHSRAIIHRDLKPANILVTEEGVVKLLDFGISKSLHDSDTTATIEGTIIGTVAYMSPEQAQGQSVDARSDIFSFGSVLFEMLSGHHAFEGDSAASVLRAILAGECPPASRKSSPGAHCHALSRKSARQPLSNRR